MASVTVGYKYSLGIHMILCHGPIDKITRIDVDGRKAWEGDSSGGSVFVNAPSLFGGEEREGGVQGTVDIEMGGPAQGQNDYLVSRIEADVPSYRGVVGAILRQVYLGMNPYLKRWSFWGQRIMSRGDGTLAQWYPEKAAIGQNMNPIHILRECITDVQWGMGYLDNDVEDSNFRAAADQLFAEGMGMSILWDRSKPINEFTKTVLEHIDGALFVNRSTGKFNIKLARGGYDVDSLLSLDQTNIQRVTDFKRRTISELSNQVTVIYWDASTGKNNSVTVQDIALAAQQGATIGTTVQYPGFTTGELASRVASRDLKALSTPLAQGTIYANRAAAGLNIGDVFKFSWPRYGIVQMVMRVVNVELGELGNNLVKLTCVEDAFSLEDAVYAAPPASEWQDPVGSPVAVPNRFLTEVPYYLLARDLGDTAAQALSSSAGYGMVAGSNPGAGATSAQVQVDEGAGYSQQAVMNFCPTALLQGTYGPAETIFAISDGVDLDLVESGQLAVLGSGSSNSREFVEVVSITDTELVVKRGMLDTPPALSTPVLTRVMFLGALASELPTEYASGESVSVKMLPTTGKGTLAIGDAPADVLTFDGRQAKPAPPGRLRINGLAYPAIADEQLTISWAHRDRLQMTGALMIDQNALDIGPEAGTSYTVRFVNPTTSAIIRTYAGISGNSQIYSIADQTLDSPPALLRVELWSVRDGLESLKHQWDFAHDFTPGP